MWLVGLCLFIDLFIVHPDYVQLKTVTSVFLDESELHWVCHCRFNFSVIAGYTRKEPPILLVINLPNIDVIFKILKLTDSAVNLQ